MTRRPDSRPNPQGKGLTLAVGFLLESSTGVRLPDLKDESPERIVEDYLSSLLVLSCEFRFMPVKNTVYYIYSNKGKVLLSMVSPREGGVRIYDEYLGACLLKGDLSWSLRLEKEAETRFSFVALLSGIEGDGDGRNAVEGERFEWLLHNLVENKTGKRNRRLGYYQNVLNYGLGKSVRLRTKRLLEAEPQMSERYQRLLPRLNRLQQSGDRSSSG